MLNYKAILPLIKTDSTRHTILIPVRNKKAT